MGGPIVLFSKRDVINSFKPVRIMVMISIVFLAMFIRLVGWLTQVPDL